jgi:hypothetical protein
MSETGPIPAAVARDRGAPNRCAAFCWSERLSLPDGAHAATCFRAARSRRGTISRAEARSRTIITIDGDLSGNHIAVVETNGNQAASDEKPVKVFLRDVTTVDQAGRMLLVRLAAKGMRLIGTGVYTSYLVQALTSATRAPRTSPIDNEDGDAEAPRSTR